MVLTKKELAYLVAGCSATIMRLAQGPRFIPVNKV